jgi:hypothetical protein
MCGSIGNNTWVQEADVTKCQPLLGARDVAGSRSSRTRRFSLALGGALPVILAASCSTLGPTAPRPLVSPWHFTGPCRTVTGTRPAVSGAGRRLRTWRAPAANPAPTAVLAEDLADAHEVQDSQVFGLGALQRVSARPLLPVARSRDGVDLRVQLARPVHRRARSASNEQQLSLLQDPVSWTGYVVSGTAPCRIGNQSSSPFGNMVVLSIYLRQRGSPESKPVGTSHSATGIEG